MQRNVDQSAQNNYPHHFKVGSALSLENMTNAGEVVVNKGPPLKVSHIIEHGGDFWSTLADLTIETILTIFRSGDNYFV